MINSTEDQISCRLSLDSGLEVGVGHPVSVQVKDIGTAINVAAKEFDRRFVVLPVIDSFSPKAGGTAGHTRLTIQGSGFSADLETALTVAGMPCRVRSVNYTSVTCDTSPASVRAGEAQVNVGGIAGSCPSSCDFQYSSELNPQVTGLSPDTVSGNSTPVTVSGSGFGSSLDDVEVFAGDVRLEATAVTDDSISLAVGAMPVGDRTLKVVITSKGLALGSATLRSLAQASLAPSAGSTSGGTSLLITGNGFVPGNTSVTVDAAPCWLKQVMPDSVSCVTPPHPAGSVKVQIRVLDVEYPPLNFTYSLSETPKITAVNPGSGTNLRSS